MALTTWDLVTDTAPSKNAIRDYFEDINTYVSIETAQASTAGTAINFTGIPSGTKTITIIFDSVSVLGGSNIYIQIGDSGGIEATGYDSASTTIGVGTVGATAAFVIRNTAGANHFSGTYTLHLLKPSTFTWAGQGCFAEATTPLVTNSAGSKSLSAELDRVTITSVGPDTFDNGTINIQYE